MITKVLEYMTCFCGDKLEQKRDSTGLIKGIEDSKRDDFNEEKEKLIFLIDLISVKYFPRKKKQSTYILKDTLTHRIPKLQLNNIISSIVYDSDTEIFKTSEGIY